MKRCLVLLLLLLAPPVVAQEPDTICSFGKWGAPLCIRKAHYAYDTCRAIHGLATRHGLDPHFLARLLWQESRFDPNARSPVGAEGIAQFMPDTARLRGLNDTFNPVEAIEHSAQYLSEMTRKYGNIGLAAIGYNGGERRAEGVIAGTGGLARETVEYVAIITGLPYEDWLAEPAPAPDLRLSPTLPFAAACLDLARNSRMTRLEPPEPARKPWGIQMAFGITKDSASRKFADQTKSCAHLIKGQKPDLVYEKSRASPKGGYFMARLGRDDRDQAWRDCNRMKDAGCLCAIYRNE